MIPMRNVIKYMSVKQSTRPRNESTRQNKNEKYKKSICLRIHSYQSPHSIQERKSITNDASGELDELEGDCGFCFAFFGSSSFPLSFSSRALFFPFPTFDSHSVCIIISLTIVSRSVGYLVCRSLTKSLNEPTFKDTFFFADFSVFLVCVQVSTIASFGIEPRITISLLLLA